MTFSNSCTHRKNCQLRKRRQRKTLLCSALPSGSKKKSYSVRNQFLSKILRVWMWCCCIDRHMCPNAMYKLQKKEKELQPHFPFKEETQKSLKNLSPIITMHGWTETFSSSLPWLLRHDFWDTRYYLLLDAGCWVRYGKSYVPRGLLCWGYHCSSAFKEGFELNW